MGTGTPQRTSRQGAAAGDGPGPGPAPPPHSVSFAPPSSGQRRGVAGSGAGGAPVALQLSTSMEEQLEVLDLKSQPPPPLSSPSHRAPGHGHGHGHGHASNHAHTQSCLAAPARKTARIADPPARHGHSQMNTSQMSASSDIHPQFPSSRLNRPSPIPVQALVESLAPVVSLVGATAGADTVNDEGHLVDESVALSAIISSEQLRKILRRTVAPEIMKGVEVVSAVYDLDTGKVEFLNVREKLRRLVEDDDEKMADVFKMIDVAAVSLMFGLGSICSWSESFLLRIKH